MRLVAAATAWRVTNGDAAFRWSDTANVENPASSAHRARSTSCPRSPKPAALMPNRIIVLDAADETDPNAPPARAGSVPTLHRLARLQEPGGRHVCCRFAIVRIATLNDLAAEWTGGIFDATGTHFYVSIQHNISARPPSSTSPAGAEFGAFRRSGRVPSRKVGRTTPRSGGRRRGRSRRRASSGVRAGRRLSV